MAKAFSEKERSEIRERILETALDLFHDKGTKTLSIKELTTRVGIAQGSFYHFWENKEALVLDLMFYRSAQKLSELEERFDDSLEEPAEFLAGILYEQLMDLVSKMESKKIYSDAFKLIVERNEGLPEGLLKQYHSFLDKLVRYWKDNFVVKDVDEQALLNVFVGSFVLCMNVRQFDRAYFRQVLRVYLTASIDEYVKRRF